jgi:glycosyltransferase involved in cell wall biosynthesis
MPAHNVARYVCEAIESIVDQSFRNWELLIRDDASTDDTVARIRRFDDPRIRLLPQRHRVGAAQARNEALAVARGDFLALQDSDDMSDPERFERQLAFLENHPEIALVGTQAVIVDRRGRPTDTSDCPEADAAVREIAFARSAAMVCPTWLLRRIVYEKVGGYDPRFQAAHDYDLELRILEQFRVANLAEPLYRYRYRLDSITGASYLRQRAYQHLARKRSALRRKGIDPDAGEAGTAVEKRFAEIRDGRFGKDERIAACKEQIRHCLDAKLWFPAVRHTFRFMREEGLTRDSLWFLRQAVKGTLTGRWG